MKAGGEIKTGGEGGGGGIKAGGEIKTGGEGGLRPSVQHLISSTGRGLGGERNDRTEEMNGMEEGGLESK